MCGINGFISAKHTEADLRQMTDCIRHRGPDGDGFFADRHENSFVGLGHRRLAIIDLSEAASQPMTSHDGRFVMVFNGEIYNFEELKHNKLPGYTWRSTGDTEVVLEGFVKYGPEFFGWMNGMFGLAIWDKQDKKLVVARDHLGIKPLYLYCEGHEFAFSSELKAISKIYPTLAVNREVIPAFLHLGYIPHPWSVYKNVWKLSAGSSAEVQWNQQKNVQVTERSFWKISDKISTNVLTDESRAKKELDHLLTDSVQHQLISDVPIGTFLSGGTDSSLVTALATKVAGQRINTYSIAVTDGKINEAPYAAAIARHLRTDHHELPITQKEMVELVPSFLEVFDEPFTDSSAFPTMLVSKLARQHVTVALSGDGGDELFWGYGSYLWTKRLQNPLLRLGAPLISAATKLLNSRYQRAGTYFSAYPRGHFKSHLFSQDQYLFAEHELRDMLVQPAFDFSTINHQYTGRNLSPVEQASFWDIENYLKDDLLVKMDRASMRYSLETRVPLLDYRVVEFALNLSPALKISSDGTMKYLLKQVLYDYVPKPLLDRPKWGFSIPLVKWLKTDLKWLVDRYCSEDVVSKTGLVKFEYVNRLVKRYQSGKSDYLYNRIWALIVLHWFFYERS